MSELSPEAQSLVDRERSVVNPRDDDRARLRARLAATLGTGAFASTTLVASSVDGAAKGAEAAAGGFSLGAKVGLALALIGALSGVALFGARGAEESAQNAPPARSASETPRVVPPEANGHAADENALHVVTPPEPAPPESVAPGPTRSARPRATPPAGERPAARDAAPAAPLDALGRELALLGRAQEALRGGDARAALALTDAHAREFAQGAMRVERLGIAALARCTLGERDAPEVSEFRALGERSPLFARVVSVCGVP